MPAPSTQRKLFFSSLGVWRSRSSWQEGKAFRHPLVSLFCQKWELLLQALKEVMSVLSPTSQSSCLHKEQVKTNYCYNWGIWRDTNPLLLELSSPHFAKAEVRNLPSSLNSQNPRGTDRSPEVHPKGIKKRWEEVGPHNIPIPPSLESQHTLHQQTCITAPRNCAVGHVCWTPDTTARLLKDVANFISSSSCCHA